MSFLFRPQKPSKFLHFLAGLFALFSVLFLSCLIPGVFLVLARLFPCSFYCSPSGLSDSFFISDKAFKSYLYANFPEGSLQEIQKQIFQTKPALLSSSFLKEALFYVILAFCVAIAAAALLSKRPALKRLFIRQLKLFVGLFLALFAVKSCTAGVEHALSHRLRLCTAFERSDVPCLLRGLYKTLNSPRCPVPEGGLDEIEYRALKTGGPTPAQIAQIIDQILIKISFLLADRGNYLDKIDYGRPLRSRREALISWRKLLLKKSACEKGLYTSHQLSLLVEKRRNFIEERQLFLKGLMYGVLSVFFLRNRRKLLSKA